MCDTEGLHGLRKERRTLDGLSKRVVNGDAVPELKVLSHRLDVVGIVDDAPVAAEDPGAEEHHANPLRLAHRRGRIAQRELDEFADE